MAWLLDYPYYSLLGTFPETAGTCQSLFHLNPRAQCSWQRPLLLVQQKVSLRRHPSDSHLRLRPFCSRHSHSQETQLVLAGCAPVDNRIAFTPLPSALWTVRLRYDPFPPSANTAVGQLPTAWSAALRNSTLPPPGYPSLCPRGTRVVQGTIIASSSEAPPKPFTSLHGLARRLNPPSSFY